MSMKKWVNVEFESSSQKTPQFKSFSADFKKKLKAQLPKHLSLVSFNIGHFYLSGFVKNELTNKIAYFSTRDVRGDNSWYSSLLNRTATSVKDFTGGRNEYCAFDEIGTRLDSLTA